MAGRRTEGALGLGDWEALRRVERDELDLRLVHTSILGSIGGFMTTAVLPVPRVTGAGETQHTARLWDGTELFYRAWEPAAGGAQGGVLLLHRGHEHSGRLRELAERLSDQ